MSSGDNRQRAVRAAQGTRVALFDPSWSDEGEFVELRLASRAFLAPWEATIDGEDPFRVERFRRFMQRGARRRRFLIRRNDTGELVGAVSLSEIDRDAHSAIVGYWIGAAHARQGFMSEALGLALEIARSELGVARVTAFVLPENAPSRALLSKLGFSLELVEPRHQIVAGVMRDHERWARTLSAT